MDPALPNSGQKTVSKIVLQETQRENKASEKQIKGISVARYLKYTY